MTVVFLIAALALLTTVATVRKTAWAERGIRLGVPYPVLATTQNLIALTAGLLVADRISTAAGIGVAAFTWLAVLTFASDLSSRMLPREACNTVTLIGLPLFAVSWSGPAAFALIMCLIGLVAIPWALRAVTRKGLGFGDIRLLTAATTTLSWWVGQDYLLYALLGAVLLQILAHVVTWPWRDRIGDHEPRPSRPTASEPVGAAATETVKVRTRRMLPFGPALVTGMLTAAVYVTVTAMDVCAQWGYLAAC
jgi:prepilin signal peptidase PulO-like enzyme (type II secretory pathway)